MEQEETFGMILERIVPSNISLAKITREADVDYSYVFTAKKGERDGKEVRPSVTIIEKLLGAMRRLNIEVSKEDEMALYNTAANLPEGYKVVSDDEPPENWADYPQELQEALAYTTELSVENRRYVYKLWREQARAHAEIERQLGQKRAEINEMEKEIHDKSKN